MSRSSSCNSNSRIIIIILVHILILILILIIIIIIIIVIIIIISQTATPIGRAASSTPEGTSMENNPVRKRKISRRESYSQNKKKRIYILIRL